MCLFNLKLFLDINTFVWIYLGTKKYKQMIAHIYDALVYASRNCNGKSVLSK